MGSILKIRRLVFYTPFKSHAKAFYTECCYSITFLRSICSQMLQYEIFGKSGVINTMDTFLGPVTLAPHQVYRKDIPGMDFTQINIEVGTKICGVEFSRF